MSKAIKVMSKAIKMLTTSTPNVKRNPYILLGKHHALLLSQK